MKTGKTRKTIERAVKRGKDIPNVADLVGTSLDKGAELDALAKLGEVAPDLQTELIEQAKSGENVSAKAELAAAAPLLRRRHLIPLTPSMRRSMRCCGGGW